MTKILEINSCKECPKRITNGNHWICSDASLGIVNPYVNSYEIPAWCPLEDMEEIPAESKILGETLNISSVVAERFMQMDMDICEFIRQEVEKEVKAELDRRGFENSEY